MKYRISDMVKDLPEDYIEDELNLNSLDINKISRLKEKVLKKSGKCNEENEGMYKNKNNLSIFKILIASVIVLLTCVTISASPKISQSLAEIFKSDGIFSKKLNLLNDNSQIGDSNLSNSDNNDITINLEEGYKDEAGGMFLLSFKDSKNRISKDSLVEFSNFENIYTNTLLKENNNIIYGIVENTANHKNSNLVINGIYPNVKNFENVDLNVAIIKSELPEKEYHNLSYFSELGDYKSVGNIDFKLLDMFVSDKGLVLRINYTTKGEKNEFEIRDFDLSLKDTNNNIKSSTTCLTSSSYANSSNSTNKEIFFFEAIFEDFSQIPDFENYKLLMNYNQYDGYIQGDWNINLEALNFTDSEKINVNENLLIDGYNYMFKKLIVTKTAIVCSLGIDLDGYNIDEIINISSYKNGKKLNPIFQQIKLADSEIIIILKYDESLNNNIIKVYDNKGIELSDINSLIYKYHK
ncbi:MAG: hypothetical protein LBV08_09475 [Clostridiales bacterium]|jgi:hypothetical protein|nr:hypothetical protein [Clostridiales bacterium]